MPLIKMDLSVEAMIFLGTEAMPEEIEAFREASALVREDPIEYSDVYLGRKNVPYTLRYFRFGGCLAFFRYHMTGDYRTERIEVTTCKRSKPRPKQE